METCEPHVAGLRFQTFIHSYYIKEASKTFILNTHEIDFREFDNLKDIAFVFELRFMMIIYRNIER